MRFNKKLLYLAKKQIRRLGYDVVRIPPILREVLIPNPSLSFKDAFSSELITQRYTCLSCNEQNALTQVIHNLSHPGPIIEFGTLFGSSARIISLANRDKRKILTVDNCSWNPLELKPLVHLKIIDENLKDLINDGHLEFYHQSFEDFQAQYSGETPSLVFIDGDHSYASTTRDISWAKNTGCEVICGHDYSQPSEGDFWGVIKAVDEAGGPRELTDSFWILRS